MLYVLFKIFEFNKSLGVFLHISKPLACIVNLRFPYIILYIALEHDFSLVMNLVDNRLKAIGSLVLFVNLCEEVERIVKVKSNRVTNFLLIFC